MIDPASRPPVLILDPDNFTPYYDANLCAALGRRGWSVEWLTSPYLFETIPDPPGVAVRHRFFRFKGGSAASRPAPAAARRLRKALTYPCDMLRLDRELAVREPGILHVQWALLPWLDAAYWRRWRRRGWRIVYTAHDAARLAGTAPWRAQRSGRGLLRVADAVVAHSSFERGKLIELGAPPSRVFVVPQGGPGIFQGRDWEKAGARRVLGLDPGCPVILFFGLIKPYKGLETLLRAFPAVRRAIPGAALFIAGQPMMPMRRCERRIAAPELSGSVVWKNGYVASADAPAVFAAADVVALPYRAASTSAVLPFAFAYGCPVVASAVGGLPEMIEPGETGLLAPPDDPAAFAAALIELLSDPARCAAMRERARHIAETRHSWDSIAAMTEAAYNRPG